MKRFNVYFILLLVSIIVALTACGGGAKRSEMSITGKVDVSKVEDQINGPVMVAIVRSNAGTQDLTTLLSNDLADSMLSYFSVNTPDLTFNTDISDTGVRPGDVIYVFAYIANGYRSGFIQPDEGDFIGFHTGGKVSIKDQKLANMKLEYRLEPGVNKIELSIDREYIPVEALISGNVIIPEDITASEISIIVVAYITEDRILSMDYKSSTITADGIIGVDTIPKLSNAQPGQKIPYEVEISWALPYDHYNKKEKSLRNVSLFALIDINNDGYIDVGDWVGYLPSDCNSDADHMFVATDDQDEKIRAPQSLSIHNNERIYRHTDIDYFGKFEDENDNTGSEENSDNTTNDEDEDKLVRTVTLRGTVRLPENAVQDEYFDPAYIIVASKDLFNDPENFDWVNGLYYFNRFKFDPLKKEGNTFEFQFQTTKLHDDEILIAGLWDRDNCGWFPWPTIGDFIGMHYDKERGAPTYQLKEGDIADGIEIDISREYFPFDDVFIEGKFLNASSGTATVFAYAGELDTMNMTEVNYDAIIGVATKEITPEDRTYKLKIQPFGYDLDIKNVCVYAMLDTDGDNTTFEKLGFHPNPQGTEGDVNGGYPKILTIGANGYRDIDIKFSDADQSPGPKRRSHETPISFSGSFKLPSDYDGYDRQNSAIFLFILSGMTNMSDVFDASKMNQSLKYFKKLPVGESSFTVNEDAGFYPDDKIIAIAFWDKDYNGVYPMPSTGDMLGIYYENNLDALIRLEDGKILEHSDEDTSKSSFEINRIYIDHNVHVRFQMPEIGDSGVNYIHANSSMSVAVIHGNPFDVLNFFTFDINTSRKDDPMIVTPNFDRIVGVSTFDVIDDPSHWYEMNISKLLSASVFDSNSTGFNRISPVYLIVIVEDTEITEDSDADGVEWLNSGYLGYYSKKIDPNRFFGLPFRLTQYDWGVPVEFSINMDQSPIMIPRPIFFSTISPLHF